MKKLLVLVVAALAVLNMNAKKPMNFYLIGDETMAELTQPEEVTPESAMGWGQHLNLLLPGGSSVENHAIEEGSSRKYLEDGKWTDVLARIERGSTILIQLGQYEYGDDELGYVSTIEQFEDNLLQMIQESKKKGAKVVLLTPMAKNVFRDSLLIPRHGGYSEAVRRVAKHAHLPLIDVDQMTTDLFIEKGEEETKSYFAEGEGVRLSANGSKEIAEMIVNEGKAKKIKGF